MKTRDKKIILIALFVFSVVFAARVFAEDIVVDQNTTWTDGAYDYNSVLITNGAVLTFGGNVTLSTQYLTIDSGSSISANGTGYPGEEGPGVGGLYLGHGTGGGYGGKGGSRNDTGGSTYGSSVAPIDLGSGGGNGNATANIGGAGGGAIKLDVSSLTVNGNISADGGDGTNYVSIYGGGGSGGSIYITANQLSGSGSIAANGGYGKFGGGGGGKIAIYYSTSTFQGTVESKGGTGITNADYGQDGTVVFFDTLNNVLYPGRSFRFEEYDSPLSYNKVVLNDSKVSVEGSVTLTTNELAADSNSTFAISGEMTVVTVVDLSVTDNSKVVMAGNSKLTVTGTVNLENSSIATAGPQNLTLPSQDITLATGSTLIWGPGTYAYEDILITDNSSLIFGGAVTLEATSVTIDPCCSLSANGTGYPEEQGPGAGGSMSGSGTGGGYGGKGGARNDTGGATYGSSIAPTDLGSGGGSVSGDAVSGAGGGAIRLNVDSLVVNGNVSADGGDGTMSSYGGFRGGGGSGGSIYITANQFSGSGLISANGGYGILGGGGGGRIAIYYSTSAFQGTVESKGGTGSTKDDYGQDGTVGFFDTLNNIFYSGHSFVFEESDSPFNLNNIVIDNSRVSNKGSITLNANDLTVDHNSVLAISGDATVGTVDTLHVLDSSILTVIGGACLTVNETFDHRGSTVEIENQRNLNIPMYPNFTVTEESTFIWGQGTYTYEDILITDNSSLIFDGAVTLKATSVTIDPCCSISANGTGYPGEEGPGAGGSYLVHGTGGGYGGRGGSRNDTGGITYGSSVAPIDLGSGGGTERGDAVSGAGGGAIRLSVNNLAVNGNISADGGDETMSSSGGYHGGGGSGGSIYITANQFSGSGLISANGGYGKFGGGGGGRVAIYYSTSTFQGTVEAEGGTGYMEDDYGQEGSILFEEPSMDSPVTAMRSSAAFASESTLSETLRALTANLTNMEVTGDFNSVMNFSDFEVVTIESGSFTGQGFAKATWQVNLDGLDYAGLWHAMVTRVQTETGSTIYMKGAISGEISGITEGYFVESANEPNIIHAYSSKWMLSRMKDQVVSSTIELSGVLGSQQTTDYPATSLYVLQASFDAESYGHYTGPLGVILTHVRVTAQSNAYYGEGFSVFSYISDAGQGLASCYNTLEAPAVALLKGNCGNPLLGILSATLDESSSVKRLSVTIERVDFGLPPAPLVSIELWAPSQVSPGETVNYIIEYRNDGTKPAENVHIVHKLPQKVQFLSHTGEGYYRVHGAYDDVPEVVWIVDVIPPKSKGYLGTTVLVDWGLTESDILNSFAMAEQHDFSTDPNITIDSTEIEANDTSVTVEYVIYDGNDGYWTIDETGLVQEAVVEMNEPNLIFTETATGFIASLQFTANPLFCVYSEATKCGSPRDLDILIQTYIMKAPPEVIAKYDRYIIRIREDEYITWLYENDFIDADTFDDFKECSKEDIDVVYPIEGLFGRFDEAGPYYELIIEDVKDSLIGLSQDKLGAAIVEHESQKEEPRIQTDSPEHAIQDSLKLHMNRYGIVAGRPGWWSGSMRNYIEQKWFLDPAGEEFDVLTRMARWILTKIRVAFDPNKKYGPNGRVLPGQKLDYRVEFENLGKGIAFGVYFTDTLDEDVNDATLQIGPVIDVNDGSILAGPGTYNPATRTITWFVGRVDPNQGGYAEFSVDVNSEAQHGTEIINYATIYFPSVPQELRTNGVVSTVLLNLPPEADAGPDQSVHVGDVVVLDGSGSTDPDGDVLTFKWAFGLKPPGSQAVLDDPNSLNPTFIPDVPGTYTVTLRVSDGQEQSQFDAVRISTVNVAPIADAGDDQTVHVGELVTLDASGSTDSDGDLLTYSWVFESMPAGSTAVLSEPNGLNPSFVADVPGNYIVSLVVNDGTVDSEPDTVMISTVNLAPIADAGEDQAVYVGDLVTLDGSGSSDPDGDPLTYRWAFTVVPEGSDANLDDPNSVNPTFTVDLPGTYVVSLVVNDGTEDSEPDTVTISTINVAPIADAGEDQAVYIGDLVMLDGSGSWDPDGDSLTYSWSFTAVPDNSTTTLNNPNTAEPNFMVDVPGTYVIGLVVNDGTVDSGPDTVSVSTINVAPTADAGDDQSVYVGELVILDGSGSYDPDGDALSYNWAFTSVPDGSTAVLDDPTSVNPSFTADVSGMFVLSLVVNDGTVDSTPDSVTVSAVTQQTQAIIMAQQIIDTINALDTDVFKNKNNKKTLTNKFNAVINKLENAEYHDALKKLENDILRKMDGCALTGDVDKNDWIIDCDAQGAVYPLVVDLIDLLQQMI